jgi:hypothetical protein
MCTELLVAKNGRVVGWNELNYLKLKMAKMLIWIELSEAENGKGVVLNWII